MSHEKSMITFKQFLAAEHLSRVLLMKHAQESSGGTLVIYSDESVREGFTELAARLGFKINEPATEQAAPGDAA